MKLPHQEKVMNTLAKKVLANLGIDHPNKKQVLYMHTLLSGLGTLVLDFSFTRKLSDQEISCLIWSVRGNTSREIAELLGISEATVRTYYARIKEKLNCKTMEQAIFEAIRCCHLKPKFLM